MDVRVNNTLAMANKELLKQETLKFDLLKDFTFDQEIGYIVCALLDSKIRAVSSENMILSYEFDSNVKQNLLIIDKMMDVYSKITKSNKNIAIISDEKWEKVKNEYISNLKNNIKYEIINEPEVIFEDLKKDGIISNSAVDLFGDIVEVE
jgi:tRNA-binding EMAP/Myf-like protein